MYTQRWQQWQYIHIYRNPAKQKPYKLSFLSFFFFLNIFIEIINYETKIVLLMQVTRNGSNVCLAHWVSQNNSTANTTEPGSLS